MPLPWRRWSKQELPGTHSSRLFHGALRKGVRWEGVFKVMQAVLGTHHHPWVVMMMSSVQCLRAYTCMVFSAVQCPVFASLHLPGLLIEHQRLLNAALLGDGLHQLWAGGRVDAAGHDGLLQGVSVGAHNNEWG